jgi:murein DD-endopeptidase MepM/ murein hydrolase activator NlpD
VKRIGRIFSLTLLLAAFGFLGWSVQKRQAGEARFATEAQLARELADHIYKTVVLFTEGKMPSGLLFGDALGRMGVERASVAGILTAAGGVFDFRHLRAGNQLAIGRSVLGELRVVRYRIDPERELWIAPRDGDFHAEIKTIPTTTEPVGTAGRIEDSLFNAVTDAGEKPELALSLADIFGWDIDFNTDTRPGDTFRVVVEKKRYTNGQTAAYGRILAAEYNTGGRHFQAVIFHDAAGHPAYYGPDGKAMKKAFLRSPLQFGAPITSHFSYNRFHPILKVHRPHLGIDYGAPEGAPVQAIGSGRVLFAGRKGGDGNMVHLRHSNGYETMYMHLSRILVRNGQEVAQGQRIGLVGHTGLATGPHLDFRIKQQGAFRNFEALKLPPAEPVAKSQLAEFRASRDKWTALMPDLSVQFAKAQPSASPLQPLGTTPQPGSH